MLKRFLFPFGLAAGLAWFVSFPAMAEIEKIARPCEKGLCLQWWPKLPQIKGWHFDGTASAANSINVQIPDGTTFRDAETVIYAVALFKEKMPQARTLQDVIEGDQEKFKTQYAGIRIREVAPMTTASGMKLRSFEYAPDMEGNWEHVSYGEEGDFYIVFTISSRTRRGLSDNMAVYEQYIGGYR